MAISGNPLKDYFNNKGTEKNQGQINAEQQRAEEDKAAEMKQDGVNLGMKKDYGMPGRGGRTNVNAEDIHAGPGETLKPAGGQTLAGTTVAAPEGAISHWNIGEDGKVTGRPPDAPPPPEQPLDEKMWDDIMASQAQSLQDALAGVSNQQSALGRRMAEAGNGMGGLGGGFEAGQAQAMLGGADLERQARQDNNKQTIEMKMAYLQNIWNNMSQEDQQAHQKEMQKLMSDLQMDLAAMGMSDTPTEYGDTGSGGGNGDVLGDKTKGKLIDLITGSLF